MVTKSKQKPKLAMFEKKINCKYLTKIHSLFLENFLGENEKIVSNYYVLLLADLNHQSQTVVYKTEDMEYICNLKDEDFANRRGDKPKWKDRLIVQNVFGFCESEL